jgi:hypothetical protein
MALTPDDLDALARKPATVTTDAGSVTQRSGKDLKDLLSLGADATLDTGPNPQGGKASAWRQTRPARSIPPGTV